MKHRIVIAALTAVLVPMLLLGMPRAASAGSIHITGDDQFVVNWLYTPTTPDLAATARFTVTNFTATGFDLTIDLIENLTSATPNINARFVSFGFGLTPDETSVSQVVNGSVFRWGFSGLPGFGAVDVCGYAGPNCNGGGAGGLLPGQSQPGSMSIHFNGNFAQGVTFEPLVARFQTDAGSFTFGDIAVTTFCVECDEQVIPTPEPASLVLLGLGLLGVAAKLRRR